MLLCTDVCCREAFTRQTTVQCTVFLQTLTKRSPFVTMPIIIASVCVPYNSLDLKLAIYEYSTI